MNRNIERRLPKRLWPLVIVLLLAATSYAAGGGSNWPQWRGPESQGVSKDKGLPTEWSATKNLQWKAAVAGRGHSSPIVWGDHIFLTTAIEG
ncbi:MAG TPA: serine/threonine protein kinase, partial [Blastocatellia bacterium]|nr:serine/threonine protein kinase [Blastocatellia bacterium]